jgi:hypothetical protein
MGRGEGHTVSGWFHVLVQDPEAARRASMVAEDLHAQVGSEEQPRRQGLAAAPNWKRAGKLAVPAERDATTRASSSGRHRASSTRWENSGSSLRNELRGYGETARSPGSHRSHGVGNELGDSEDGSRDKYLCLEALVES